jgi:DNA replication protein DnaC
MQTIYRNISGRIDMDARSENTLRGLMESMKERQREEQEKWDALPQTEKDRILEEQRRKEEAEKREALIASYKAIGITPMFYDATWENWEANTPEKKKVLDKVRKAWNTNLFLCGKSGTGKSHLAMCLAKEGATYRRLPDIFREVRLDFSCEQKIIDYYGSVKLLVIDEVGRQNFSPFEMNLFFEIIDKRWNNILPTTLLTNMDEKEFSAKYGTAIIDRLRPVMVRFTWGSYRKELNLPSRAEPEKPEEDEEDIDF